MNLVELMANNVTRHLAVGPAPRHEQDIYYITVKMGCNVVLNVANEEFVIGYTPESACCTGNLSYCSEKEYLEKIDVDYKWMPHHDGQPYTKDDMVDILAWFNLQIKEKKHNCRIYVHCHGGMSRSPGVIAMVLVGYGHHYHDVRKYLERLHPYTIIHPKIWKCIVDNANFLAGKTKYDFKS